jgi:3-demethoxyubiquinol 3-hydroxylase
MRKLPGDLTHEQEIERMIRVDHAGEYGATRIYAGQLAVMRHSPARALVEHMMQQEQQHLKTFETLMRERKVRPTAFMPLWHVAGFALGAATALLGEKAAFACTVAVESVIDAHYAGQQANLSENEGVLAGTIEQFRAEEKEHHDTAISQDAENAQFYPILSAGIKAASRMAIWLSTRL